MHGSDIILLAWDDEEPVDPGEPEAAKFVSNGESYAVTPGGDLSVTDAGSSYTFSDPTAELPNVSDAGTYLTITN